MNLTGKKIVFITSSQLSANPRLVKEAKALSIRGCNVTIIHQFLTDWATIADREILKNNFWKVIQVGGSPTSNKLLYFFSRFRYRMIIMLARKIPINKYIAELAIGRCSKFLASEAKLHEADLYIAHNLGALPAAYKAAKKYNGKLGFDAEDFHRHESADNLSDFYVQAKIIIEDFYLKHLNYFSTSSELIAKEYHMIYPNLIPNVIQNVFEIKYQQGLNLNNNDELNLFWFSQTIGKGRGLEDVIIAINNLKNSKIKLSLLGNISGLTRNYFNKMADFKIEYLNPRSEDQLFNLASTFDIGLALEPAFCINNDLALSNKLFIYLIAGLQIIASNTKAQERFTAENPGISEIYDIGNANELANIIFYFLENKTYLNNGKKCAYQAAKNQFNWELEQNKFLSVIYQTLSN